MVVVGAAGAQRPVCIAGLSSRYPGKQPSAGRDNNPKGMSHRRLPGFHEISRSRGGGSVSEVGENPPNLGKRPGRV